MSGAKMLMGYLKLLLYNKYICKMDSSNRVLDVKRWGLNACWKLDLGPRTRTIGLAFSSVSDGNTILSLPVGFEISTIIFYVRFEIANIVLTRSVESRRTTNGKRRLNLSMHLQG